MARSLLHTRIHAYTSLHGGLGCLGAVGYALYCAQTTRNPSSTPCVAASALLCGNYPWAAAFPCLVP